jgi:hypothetical protein
MTEFQQKDNDEQYPDVVTNTESIDVEAAKVLLSLNFENRSTNSRRVSAYARAMQSGEWGLGDPLMFDKFGNLLNGQHRLMAVARCGIPVDFIVIRGLEPDSKKYIDTGMSRTVAQILTMRGFGTNMDKRVATIRAMFFGSKLKPKNKTAEKNAKGLWSDLSQTKSATWIEPFVVDHQDSLDFSLRISGPNITSPLRAVIARAYYTENHERLLSFMRGVLTGMVENPGTDNSVITLRNFLLKKPQKGDSGKEYQMLVYGKTENALRAFIKNESLSTLQATSTEYFPVADFD